MSHQGPGFKVKAILYEDPMSGERILETENLEKYSWLPELKEKYLSGLNLDKRVGESIKLDSHYRLEAETMAHP